jgi:uncharacterized membrane protein YoaK (UPF0700 family)
MRKIFLGRPLYWLLWVAIGAVGLVMGERIVHTRDFNLFITVLLALSAACVLLIFATHRKGERITREPFEDD